MTRRRKRFKTACGIVCVLGFLLMLGTAGASDFNEISFCRALIQSVISLVMFAGGAFMGGFMQ